MRIRKKFFVVIPHPAFGGNGRLPGYCGTKAGVGLNRRMAAPGSRMGASVTLQLDRTEEA